MTCIVGIKSENKIYIGGDTVGSTLYTKSPRKDEKVFINDTGRHQMIIGYTSSYRMGQLLRYKLRLPKHKKNVSDMEYLVGPFVDTLINLYKSCEYQGDCSPEDKTQCGGTFIFGYKGNLYKTESDFQIAVPRNNYESCGCGESFALGSLHSTEKTKNVKKRIKKALDAASTYSNGVEGPYNIMSI